MFVFFLDLNFDFKIIFKIFLNTRNCHIKIMYKMTLYMEKMIFKYVYDIWCRIYDFGFY